MKSLFKYILLLIIMSFPLLAQDSLQLTVTLPKTTYYLDESIEIGISVVNKGTTLVKIQDPNQRSYHILE